MLSVKYKIASIFTYQCISDIALIIGLFLLSQSINLKLSVFGDSAVIISLPSTFWFSPSFMPINCPSLLYSATYSFGVAILSIEPSVGVIVNTTFSSVIFSFISILFLILTYRLNFIYFCNPESQCKLCIA